MKSIQEQIINRRKEYSGEVLDISTVSHDPLTQFEKWMGEALVRELPDPNAMALATAAKSGHPSVRTVLLRNYSEKGFVFFANYNSQKGKEIEENPKAAVLFFWPELMRQIRIEGILEKISPVESEAYFKTRPIGNQIAAWVSQQSTEVENKKEIEDLFKQLEQKYKDKEIPYPEFWGGYCLAPNVYEFWQGQANRLHDRIQYKQNYDTGEWKIKCLAP